MSDTSLPAPAPPDTLGEPVPMVQVDGVSKFFGELVAVSDVTFDIGPGVTALLGPNGAGKSTLLRLFTGQAGPSKGTVRVFGRDPRGDRLVPRLMGVAPQQEALFENMTALRFVELAARLHGVSGPAEAARAAIDQVELDTADTRTISTYSKGMRQRVKLAQAIVHDPWILVLDEPLTGLDPRQRRSMIDLLKRFGAGGRCVVVSSHVLEEVERIGSRVLVIAKGRLAAEGDFHEIRELMDDRPHEITVRSTRARSLAARLMDTGLITSARLDGDLLQIETTNVGEFSRAVAPAAIAVDASIDELMPADDDLESVFRYLVEGR
ncbi:MAG: ABC transporter ATP-binding protein [Acidimicrobiia bacterium]|nr:ABC transporter ATP-binding protein [Acidimicrobiia bacterium]